jgi:rhodanese-related sulfurtransferase
MTDFALAEQVSASATPRLTAADAASRLISQADDVRPRRTVEQLLDEARGRLERLTPERARAAVRSGALLIDIRSELQRQRDGVIPGSRFIARNVLEWRCDSVSRWHDPAVTDARQVIVVCHEGYQSSLAAATLQRLGLVDATDVIGGFQAWQAAGLPLLHA